MKTPLPTVEAVEANLFKAVFLMPEEQKEYRLNILTQDRTIILEQLLAIDFYGWNEDTQRMIKDKIEALFAVKEK